MAKERPISPHLQVYKPQITSVLSIFHRITGVALTFGLILLVAWIFTLSLGEEYFEYFSLFIKSSDLSSIGFNNSKVLKMML